MAINDESIRELLLKKRELQKQEYEGKLTREELVEKTKEIDRKIAEFNAIKIRDIHDILNEKSEQIKENHEKIKKALPKPNRGRHVKKEGMSQMAFRLLRDPFYKNEDMVLVQMKKDFPMKDIKYLRNVVRVVISTINQRKTRRYAGYTWDKKMYLAVKKYEQKSAD